jgi:hypothetical protein
MLLLGLTVFGQKTPTSSALSLKAVFRDLGKDTVIDVFVRNASAVDQKVSFGLAYLSFSFVVRVAGKEFSLPTREHFAFADRGPMVLALKFIPAGRTVKMYTTDPLGPEFTRAFRDAKRKFSGEFHFEFAPVPSKASEPRSVLIYKTP